MPTIDLWSLVALLRAEALANPQTATTPPPLREGQVFAHILTRLPIGLPVDTWLAGDFGWQWLAVDERATWESRLAARVSSSQPLPSPMQNMLAWFYCHGSDGGSAHTTVDYSRVLTEGLAGILAEAERELAVENVSDSKRTYLEGIRAALCGVITWAERYAALAEFRLPHMSDEAERQRLRGVAATCRQVPRLPARSFREALQALWLIHQAVGLSEGSGASLSLGRMDRYLLPFYRADLVRGVPESALEDDLAAFFRALNAPWLDPARAVNLGGLDPAGRWEYNPLAHLIRRVVARLRLPAPLLAVRVRHDTSPEALDPFVDPALFEMGQPTFYGEEPCREALLQRGVPPDEVGAWAVNSCMGLLMPGQEWSNMWGTVINLLLPLELALNGGRPFAHELPVSLPVQVPADYADFDALFESVCACMGALVDLYVSHTATQTEQRGRERPNPFVSALLGDCLSRGQDRLLGGCRYQTVIVECFGLVNAADALLAIRRLVFEQGRHTLGELVAAAQDDFRHAPDILHHLQSVPQYGNGDPAADEMARRLAARFADAVARHSEGGLTYAPSFHTLSVHISAGARMGASLDGRRAGVPLAKNVGTSPGKALRGHTALMRSAATIDQRAFGGGQALDISVDPAMLRTLEDRRKFQALLRTYFALGGLQVQVNGVSVETLRRARANPEAYRDVLVRKAGFSTHFVTLPDAEQVELIERFAAGL